MTKDEVRRIAALAHLEFDDAGLERMAAEMTVILQYIDQLKQVEGLVAEGRAATPMRDDVLEPGVARSDVERNAPKWHDGQFVVPKVIE